MGTLVGTLVGIAVCVGNKRAATATAEAEPTGIMTFADPAMQALCAKTWGDGTNITYEQAREVTEIPKNWAKGNKTITSFNEIKYFKNCTTIGYSAFEGCSSLALTSFELPQCTTISNYAFKNCSSMALTSLELPQCTTIGEQAFYGCTSLKIEDLSLPNLTSLGQNAFYGVKIKKISNLGNIKNLPTATSSTQNFGSKSVLEEFIIPSGATTLPSNTFYGYNVLASIHPEGSTSTFDLGDVIAIGENCFRNCTGLTATPDLTKIERIGKEAFQGAKNIAFGDLILPNLTTIGIRAFYISGVGLRRILDLGQITTLEANNGTNVSGTFVYCSALELAILPSTLTTMGTSANPFIGCTKLSTMILKAEIPPSLGSKFVLGSHVSSSLKIYVPDESVEAYKAATNWVALANIILPLSQFNG